MINRPCINNLIFYSLMLLGSYFIPNTSIAASAREAYEQGLSLGREYQKVTDVPLVPDSVEKTLPTAPVFNPACGGNHTLTDCAQQLPKEKALKDLGATLSVRPLSPWETKAKQAGMMREKKQTAVLIAETLCQHDGCWHAHATPNTAFAHSAAALTLWQSAAKDHTQGVFFQGTVATCREMVWNYLNCCQDKGWGKDLQLSQCKASEKALGIAKQKKRVIYLGHYCAKKKLGHCLSHRKSYCVFQSPIARLIQEKGRYQQLGWHFGSPKHPHCEGLTPDELAQIDLSQLNFNEILSTATLPHTDFLPEQKTDSVLLGIQDKVKDLHE